MRCDGLILNRLGSFVHAARMNSDGVRAQCLELTSMVVGIDEQMQVGPKLLVAVVVVAFDGCVPDCAVHPLEPDRLAEGWFTLVSRCSISCSSQRRSKMCWPSQMSLLLLVN